MVYKLLPRAIGEPVIQLRNTFVYLAGSRLQKAQMKFQERVTEGIEFRKMFMVTQAGKNSLVCVERTWFSLRQSLADFSEISGHPVENREQYSDGNPWLYVYDLYVPRSLRHRGIGSQLLEQATEYAKWLKAPMVLNISKPNKKLHAFYTKNGFRQISPTIYFK